MYGHWRGCMAMHGLAERKQVGMYGQSEDESSRHVKVWNCVVHSQTEECQEKGQYKSYEWHLERHTQKCYGSACFRIDMHKHCSNHHTQQKCRNWFGL